MSFVINNKHFDHPTYSNASSNSDSFFSLFIISNNDEAVWQSQNHGEDTIPKNLNDVFSMFAETSSVCLPYKKDLLGKH